MLFLRMARNLRVITTSLTRFPLINTTRLGNYFRQEYQDSRTNAPCIQTLGGSDPTPMDLVSLRGDDFDENITI